MMEPRRPGGADVHTRSEPDWFETFENGDVLSLVARGSLGLLGHEGFLSVTK
jgi:hypothetical protein